MPVKYSIDYCENTLETLKENFDATGFELKEVPWEQRSENPEAIDLAECIIADNYKLVICAARRGVYDIEFYIALVVDDIRLGSYYLHSDETLNHGILSSEDKFGWYHTYCEAVVTLQRFVIGIVSDGFVPLPLTKKDK